MPSASAQRSWKLVGLNFYLNPIIFHNQVQQLSGTMAHRPTHLEQTDTRQQTAHMDGVNSILVNYHHCYLRLKGGVRLLDGHGLLLITRSF
jgi:hypothetical protein